MVPRILKLALILAPFAAAEEPQMKPRDLFYSKVTSVSGSPGEGSRLRVSDCSSCGLAVRYRVQRRQPDGGFLGVDPATTVFGQGDEIRISVQSNVSAHMYAIQRGSSGKWSSLLPAPGEPPVAVEPGGSSFIPADPGAFGFDSEPGQENLYLIVSTRPDVDVDALIRALNNRESAGPSAPVVMRLLHSGPELRFRDLVLEKSSDHTDAGKQETAFYAANQTSATAVPVIVKLTLDHQPK